MLRLRLLAPANNSHLKPLLSKHLHEAEDELSIAELKLQNVSVSQCVENMDGETVAHAVTREREAEWALAERWHAAGEAAATRYWEHGDEAVTQVGNHKPQCGFSRQSFGLANVVGCTCGYLAKQEKAKKKKEGKNKPKQ